MVTRDRSDTDTELQRIRQKKIWTADDLAKLPKVRWEIPNLLPAPGVVMISGPKSSLKSYVVLACCMSIVYERDWWDGTKLRHGYCFYVTGEDEKLVGDRRVAWLRAHDLPVAQQDGFRVLNIEQEEYVKPDRDRIDLLDRQTIEMLIEDFTATAKAEGSRVAVVVIDPLTSLLPKLTDEVCRILVRHLKMLANALDCTVVIVNHTHRKNARTHQGSHVLADSIDGDLIAVRDWQHKTNGVQTGLRTLLYIERLKRRRDVDYTTEWVGTPMIVQGDGGEETTCAMDCTGLTGSPAVDQHAITRSWIALRLPPGNISIPEAIKLCGWAKGGSQYRDIRDSIPMDEWIAVQLPDGKTVKELRRVKVGRGERIECRLAELWPAQEEARKPEAKPEHEPEVDAAKRRQREENPGARHGGGKPLGTVRAGKMSQADYHAALDEPLAEAARDAHGFRSLIFGMRDRGAEITDEGAKLLDWLTTRFATETGRDMVLRLFATQMTARAVLRVASAKMKAAEKGKAKGKDAAAPDGEPS
jgi:hypothetical protein